MYYRDNHYGVMLIRICQLHWFFYGCHSHISVVNNMFQYLNYFFTFNACLGNNKQCS